MSVQTGAVGQAATRVLFESTSEGILFASAEGRVVAANPAATLMLDRELTQTVGLALHGPEGLLDEEDPRGSLLAAERHRSGSGAGVVRLRRGDGKFAEFEVTLRAFRSEDGTEHSCLLVRDIEGRLAIEREIEELSSRLLQLSRVDDLTGFHNRRGLIASGTKMLQQADHSGSELQVLYVDARNVKELNDRLGHEAGDAALQAIARALSVTFQKSDLLARVSGTSFAVLARDLDASRLDVLVGCVREHLDAPETFGYIGAAVEVAFGSTTRSPGETTSLEELVNRADRLTSRSRRQRGVSR
jgi:diguanylate cyclase (GGDEF)-like protein/PAS domain S-box-containing protein